MEETANLSLPYILPSQAQKHVTHNEALRRLDAVVHLSVLDRDRVGPPTDPEEGQRFLVAEGALDAWAGREGWIAAWQDGGWQFIAPGPGWLCWIEDEALLVCWTGVQWQTPSDAPTTLQNLSLLGVGATADASNPFAATLNKALWSALYAASGGDGDLRFTMNKETAGDVLSILLQSGWEGRAEIGLVGNDDLALRVSADGENWQDALLIDNVSGTVRAPAGLVHGQTGILAPLYIPAPTAEIWRLDASRQATPRVFTIGAVTGAEITLTTASVDRIFGTNMRGQAAVRIWNMSRDPIENAWIDWNMSASSFRVTDAAHIAGWGNGDMLRLGDPNPTGENVLDMVALDISGYLLANLGAVFPQKGVFLSLSVASSDGSAALHLSSSGAFGSAVGSNALSNGVRNQSSLPVPTRVPSPISNSNLLFLRELTQFGATNLTTAYARVLGVYG